MKKYANAKNILPSDLVEEIQKYIDGAHLYIPQKSRKSWGSLTGAKEQLAKRNLEIQVSFQKGMRLDELSQEFGLSEDRIRSIVYGKNDGSEK